MPALGPLLLFTGVYKSEERRFGRSHPCVLSAKEVTSSKQIGHKYGTSKFTHLVHRSTPLSNAKDLGVPAIFQSTTLPPPEHGRSGHIPQDLVRPTSHECRVTFSWLRSVGVDVFVQGQEIIPFVKPLTPFITSK